MLGAVKTGKPVMKRQKAVRLDGDGFVHDICSCGSIGPRQLIALPAVRRIRKLVPDHQHPPTVIAESATLKAGQ